MLLITIPFYHRHGHFIHIPGKQEMAKNVDHDRLLFYEWSGVNLSSLYRPICTDAWSLRVYELYCLLLLLFVIMIGK